jgi:hypothetical protein
MKLLVVILMVTVFTGCATLLKDPCASVAPDKAQACQDEQAARQEHQQMMMRERPNNKEIR